MWDGLVALFLVFWTIGIVTELQRSEIIDLSRLLHLPVSLRDVFLLNYLASHFSFSLALMLPAMLGLTVGLVLGTRARRWLLLFPLVFGFFFMITAWTYCLRGWLASLMVNKRRRRAIIMGVTMAFVLLAQLPNLLTNVWFARQAQPSADSGSGGLQAVAIATGGGTGAGGRHVRTQSHRYIPFLWLPLGAKALAEGRRLAGGVGRLRHVRDREVGTGTGLPRHAPLLPGRREPANSARRRPPCERPAPAERILVERTLPAIPEEAAAMAFASLPLHVPRAGSEDGPGHECIDLRRPRREHAAAPDARAQLAPFHCVRVPAVRGQRRRRRDVPGADRR